MLKFKEQTTLLHDPDELTGIQSETPKPNQKVISYLITDYDQLNKIASAVDTKQPNKFIAYKDIKGTYVNSLFKGNVDKTSGRNEAYYDKYSQYTDPKNDFNPWDANADYKGIRIKNLSNGYFITFKAFIENFSDGFSPKWNDITYVGRPDTFRIYTGLTRTIGLTFLLVDFTGYDQIWRQTNDLARLCSPSFDSSGKMISPVLKLSILDLIDEVGYIDRLDIGIEKDFPWDMNPKQNDAGTLEVNIKPMACSIQITFQSMMDRLPSDTAVYFKDLI